jgi:TRAP-type C4-dicarboxylate transport system permease small subunit
MFERIHARLSRLSQIAAWAGGAALTLTAILVTFDVFSRKFIGWTLGGSDEITGYVFAAATTWAYSYCLLHRANVRIDAIYNWLPRWFRASLDLVSIVMLLIFVGFLTERAFNTFYESFVNNTISITPMKTPLWIPQAFWVAGLVFFLASLVFMLVYAGRAYIRRDFAAVNRSAGAITIEEEVEEDTRGTEAERRRG